METEKKDDAMKIDCGPTRKEYKNGVKQWHNWFAWYPVRVASHDCRWLETVERKGQYVANYSFIGWEWEYRAN